MNKTFTVLANKHCLADDHVEPDQSLSGSESGSQLSPTLDANRFCTFTKYKIKQPTGTVVVNERQQRYFDSPTMIIPDEDIPVSRCSNRTAFPVSATTLEPSLDETELSDLLVFTNPNRVLTESMHVVVSRHPSLQDLKYINDVSSILLGPSGFMQEKDEPIYQELVRVDQWIATPPTDYANDVDDNKENRPPLMPIKCPTSRIPIWTPPPTSRNTNTAMPTGKKQKHEDMKKKVTATKPSLTDILDQWSSMAPKLKELLSETRKMPLRVPHLTANSFEFRRLKQLLNDLEVTTSSWTNAINQCRYVLQHAQQQLHRA